MGRRAGARRSGGALTADGLRLRGSLCTKQHAGVFQRNGHAAFTIGERGVADRRSFTGRQGDIMPCREARCSRMGVTYGPRHLWTMPHDLQG